MDSQAKPNIPISSQQYAGVKPSKAQALIVLGDDYALYLMSEQKGWVNLKAIRTEASPRRGNFWLGWSVEDARFAATTDLAWLKAHDPDLLDWVKGAMIELWPEVEERY